MIEASASCAPCLGMTFDDGKWHRPLRDRRERLSWVTASRVLEQAELGAVRGRPPRALAPRVVGRKAVQLAGRLDEPESVRGAHRDTQRRGDGREHPPWCRPPL